MARQLLAVVVQDHDPLGKVMQEVLRGEGYEVLTASDEGGAAVLCGERSADLVVVDVHGRSSGYDALLELMETPDGPTMIEVRDEPAVVLPFFGPWRVEGRRLTLRRPFRLTDFVAAVRELSGGQKSA